MQYALASPLKRALNAIFGWEMKQWDDRAWKEAEIPELGFSPRRAAQTLGTEWGRSLKDDLWLLLAGQVLRFYENALDLSRDYQRQHPGEQVVEPYYGMVISDVRFENEAEWVRANGGEVWHITRPGTVAVAAHASEAGVTQHCCDVVLHNTGTVNGIQQAAQLIAAGDV